MAVRIRMKRMGRRNRPYYRMGVFDARTPRDGSAIEMLGTYDPLNPNLDKQVTVKADRAVYWLQQGAQPSETVASILKKLQITKDGAPDEPVKLSDVVKEKPKAEEPAPEPKAEEPAPDKAEAEAPAEPKAEAPAQAEADEEKPAEEAPAEAPAEPAAEEAEAKESE